MKGSRNPYPLCTLYTTRIVSGFPAGCPLAKPNVSAALDAIRDSGFQPLLDADGDDAAGLAALDRYDLCRQCVGQLLRNRRVKRLRAGYPKPVAAVAKARRLEGVPVA